MIPYGRQDIRDEDIGAVVEVLRSDWLTQGPTMPRFEAAIAAHCEAAQAVAVCSATAALHIACLALDLGHGDVLWTVPNTFVASANCALYCGARVDFVDIDPRTYNMSVEALREKLVRAERAGCLPKVVIPVHFAGQSCDMRAIRALAEHYGFRIIEDASHAVGGSYLNAAVGNCQYSDIAVFSFHPVKIITTAEGGMALTNDAELAERLRVLRTHGITRDVARMREPSQDPWYYEQVDLGFNYRMTDVQAALGVSQSSRLREYITRRRSIARIYDEALQPLPLILPFQHPDAESAFHLYVIQIDPSRAALDRRSVFNVLRAAGIGVNVHYIPVHTQPHYRTLGFAPGQYPVAERYYANALSLPMFATLGDSQQNFVISSLRKALG